MRTGRLFIFIAVLFTGTVNAQKLVSEQGTVSFFSHATLEDIAAVNEKALSIFNTFTGEIVFSIPIAEFRFDRSLMEEHFNEKYMHTDKYPKSTFQGKIQNFKAEATDAQLVNAIGKLSMHGVTKDVTIAGTAQKVNNKWQLKSKFPLKLEDYNVEIPQLLWEKIAETVEVTVEFTYK
jgi:polyisoprenoid-binding protein YceI